MASLVTTERFPWQSKQFWEHQIGTKWTNVLAPLLRSEYMNELMCTLSKMYADEERYIFPKKLDIFKAFRLTPFEEVKVIILGQDPYHNGRATGLAFANPKEFEDKPSPALRRIRQQTPSFGVSTDVGLEKWAQQGVLLLNTALTVEQAKPGSHATMWTTFTKRVLELMCDNHSGLIFLLWGSHAQKHEAHINERLHYIIKAEHPTAGIYKGSAPWEANNCFEKTNDLLLKNNGAEFLIHW